MKGLIPGIKKELLILVRDLPGLAILFIMPVLLIMIVTLAQQNALKSSKEARTEMLVADHARSPLSSSIIENLSGSSLFDVATELGGRPVDRDMLREKVSRGDYPIGLVISGNDSALTLMADPGLQDSYRRSLSASVVYIVKGTQSKMAIETLLKTMNPGMEPVIDTMIRISMENMTPVTEIFAQEKEAVIKPTIIQNNVPGFILFAMFFIVIPLSGSLITERNEGSWQRLRTLPVTAGIHLSSKIIVYLLVCLLQFVLMLGVGTWLLPTFFGMPELQIGTQYFALAVATLAAALAAVGFGLLVGSFATTHGQAALFGSVMVVILGVISGTFLPVYLMPAALQYLSLLSPIRWGIDNYLVIFIREGGVDDIALNLSLLLCFFVFAMIVSIVIFAKTRTK